MKRKFLLESDRNVFRQVATGADRTFDDA